MRYCFALNLYIQGLLHDLSKYSLIELKTGMNYYAGYCSPIDLEKKEKGYSECFLHHKGRNKHHFDYWIDRNKDGMYSIEMPKKYVKEMLCDRIAATQVYLKDQFYDGAAYDYLKKGYDKEYMHPNTYQLIESYLLIIKNEGIKKGLQRIKSL